MVVSLEQEVVAADGLLQDSGEERPLSTASLPTPEGDGLVGDGDDGNVGPW